jgi:hypothetical protein
VNDTPTPTPSPLPFADGGSRLASGPTRQVVLAAGEVMEFLGERSVATALIALGNAFAIVAVVAQFVDPLRLSTPDFLGLLGFGAIQIGLGCFQRVGLRRGVYREPSEQRPIEEAGSTSGT